MPARPTDVARQLKRLDRCLEELCYRESAARWARTALGILERVELGKTHSRADKNEMMARCHVVLGKDAFLTAERSFWKRRAGQDGPSMSCAIRSESRCFAPAHQAMSARAARRQGDGAEVGSGPRKGAAGTSYARALHHFERANELWPDRWESGSPRNIHLAEELSCDPCMPSFYLGVIALRQGDLPKARELFARVRQLKKEVLPVGSARVHRHQVRVAAAVFEAAAAMLEGTITEANKAMTRARNLDRQNLEVLKNLGWLCELQGKPREAAEWYRAALRWERRDGYAQRRLDATRARTDQAPRRGARSGSGRR